MRHPNYPNSKMMMIKFGLLCCLSMAVVVATDQGEEGKKPLELSCDAEKDQKYANKKYLPNLITLSRNNESHYSIQLRCMGKTLAGISIHNDYETKTGNLKATLSEYTDNHYVKHVSMSCGQNCFKSAVSEFDLLTGRICLEKSKNCRATKFVVVPGMGDSNKGFAWVNLLAAIVVVQFIALGLYIVYRYRKKFRGQNKGEHLESNPKYDNPKIVVSNHKEENPDHIGYA